MVNQISQQSPSIDELRNKLIDLVTEMIVVREEVQQLEEELETSYIDERGKCDKNGRGRT